MKTLVGGVTAIARADERWKEFRQEIVDSVRSDSDSDYIKDLSDDDLAAMYLDDYLAGGPEEGRIDHWREHFIKRFAEVASDGRCRVSGIIGLRREEIPADLFFSWRFVDNLINATREFECDELILLDGTVMVAIEVKFPSRIDSVIPAAEEQPPPNRRGRKPGRPKGGPRLAEAEALIAQCGGKSRAQLIKSGLSGSTIDRARRKLGGRGPSSKIISDVTK